MSDLKVRTAMKFLYIIYRGGKTIFLVGFFIGVLCALVIIKTDNIENVRTSCQPRKPTVPAGYENWVSMMGLMRFKLDDDEFVYGETRRETESNYLLGKISVICAVYVRKVKNAVAINNTWGKRCNEIVYFSLHKEDSFPVIHFKANNSFHYLCDSIRYIWKEYMKILQWILFVPDDLFVIPENLRYYVAPLDHTIPYYMGHPSTFWGQVYNMGQAGYVLSRGAMEALQSTFNSTGKCRDGGKYWKNEDFYLGKHLGDLGISPRDTRDQHGRSRFHGYNFNQLLFPGRLSMLSSYWKRSVYPVIEGLGCCSDRSITFHGIEPDKMYLYDYLLNHLRVFNRGGQRGNRPAPTPVPEEEVWLEFLKQEGKGNMSVSSDEFFELWKNKISAPDMFNEHMRQEHLASASATATGFAHMPHVLESILNGVHSNDSENDLW
ncbi:glycoprotein-N-acetylgalactosamine 3-beta-galactosyltransferase 1 [Anabrus simplex]|uniref:glycoprotein-N-acetylgalactosamine 3-beta-galactosyltransferase 1 n=1 Tax=Anabrus simplex TaxID=316456 RepID=UPI0034DDBAE7